MRRRVASILMVLLLAGAGARLQAQDQNDPLTPDEVQQIRDSNIHPNERIKLFLKFVQERIDSLKQLTNDAGAANRMAQISGKLQEFTSLCDELQDNMDNYDQEHADIRKSLKDVVKAAANWPAVLRALPNGSNYDFAVDTAVDSAQSAYQDAKQLAAEQEVFFKIHPKMRHHNGSGAG